MNDGAPSLSPRSPDPLVVSFFDCVVVLAYLLPILLLDAWSLWSAQMTMVLVLLTRSVVVRDATRHITRCMVCKYDLTALPLPGKCPECGTGNPSLVAQSSQITKWMTRPFFAVSVCGGFALIPLVIPLAWMVFYRASAGFPISLLYAMNGPLPDSFDTPSASFINASGGTMAALVLAIASPRLPLNVARRAFTITLVLLILLTVLLALLAWNTGAVHWRFGKAGSFLAFSPAAGLFAGIIGIKLATRRRPSVGQ
jgi:hypothetical protein